MKTQKLEFPMLPYSLSWFPIQVQWLSYHRKYFEPGPFRMKCLSPGLPCVRTQQCCQWKAVLPKTTPEVATGVHENPHSCS